jgi:hypothetical protein
LSFKTDAHRLKLPNFRIIKKYHGQDVVTVKEVKSNKDVVHIFDQDLVDQKSKIKKKIEQAEKNKFDVNEITRRDESIDPTYNDQLL